MELTRTFFSRKLLLLFVIIFSASFSFGQNCKNYHVVSSGETLFGISKKYSLTVAQVESLNPGLTSALKVGQKICLPAEAKAKVEVPVPAVIDSSFVEVVQLDGDSSKVPIQVPDSLAPKKKDMYSIALLLPFSSFKANVDSLDQRAAKLRSVAVNMYRGAVMAQSAMRKNGVRATISIYDVGNSVDSGTRAVERLEANDVDLVIGPLFKDPLVEVAKWVSGRNSHLVVPIKITNKVLLLSEHMSKAYPGSNSQWYYLAGYAKKEFPNAIIVGAYGKGKDDFSMSAAMAGFADGGLDSLMMFEVTNGAVKLNEFVKGQSKKVVVLDMNSDKKLSASVSSALTGLDINIIGGDSYASDDKLKSDSKGSSKVSGTKSVMLDYYNMDHLKWIAQYRKNFKAEPDEYSAIMHDVILFYGTGLAMFGTDLNNHLNDVECPGLIFMGFDFFKTGSKTGYENAYVNVVQKMNGRWGLKNKSK